MLTAAANVAPRGVYVCGNTTTSSGLTVTLSRDSGTGDFALEAGALVLGDQGTETNGVHKGAMPPSPSLYLHLGGKHSVRLFFLQTYKVFINTTLHLDLIIDLFYI